MTPPEKRERLAEKVFGGVSAEELSVIGVGIRSMEGKGFTLIELLVVIAIIALLVSILCPSLVRATQQAKLVVCQYNSASIHKGLILYTNESNQNLPPFAFSSGVSPNLPLSGHWGGVADPGDPSAFGRIGMENINLWALVGPSFVNEASLICPAADGDLGSNAKNYFPYNERFSTYCIRFPHSEDVFRDSPDLAYKAGGELLGIYCWAAGGQRVRVGTEYQTIPLINMERTYRVDGEVFDPGQDALLVDVFWLDDESPQLAIANVQKPSACHGLGYNVLHGDGSVKVAIDNGTVSANAISTGVATPYAGRAENIWHYFDNAK